MVYITVNIIMATLAAIGLINIVRNLILGIYKCKSESSVILIVPAKDHMENIEYELRSCAAKVKWQSKLCPRRVLCLDSGMDDDTRRICEAVCSEYEFMDIVPVSRLADIIVSEQIK